MDQLVGAVRDQKPGKESDSRRGGGMTLRTIFIILCALTASCSRYGSGPWVYVTNEKSGTVSVIDSSTDRVVDRIQVSRRPRGIRISPDGKYAYVASSTPFQGKEETGDNRIDVIDTASGKVVRKIDVGDDPEQLAISPDGSRMYVSNEESGTCTVVDIDSGEIIATLITGIEPEGVTISPDGGLWVYVTAVTSSTVSIIETTGPTVVATLIVGQRPRDTAFSPDGTQAYVTAEVGQNVTVIDVATQKIVGTIPLANDSRAVGSTVSNDGTKLYVANGRGNSVSVIDIAQGKVVTNIPVGERNWGIGLVRKSGKLYTANGLSGDVSVVDTSTNKEITRIRTGEGPWGIAVRE
ncbi:MAG TPA: beta-propeller fold lactonase family protein [Pyrinomonadaceae bacterium]|nr:beta-propeller fold lactonase family protein [Pyrinomonadaceae bacterium]